MRRLTHTVGKQVHRWTRNYLIGKLVLAKDFILLRRYQIIVGLVCTLLSLGSCRSAPVDLRWSTDDPTRATMVAGRSEAAILFEQAARGCGLSGLRRETRGSLDYVVIIQVPISKFYESRAMRCAVDWIKEHPETNLVVFGPPTVPSVSP